MIKYNLKCSNKHEFESWFSDSKEFEKLNKRKLLECIFCSSKNIQKSLMAPRVLSSKKSFEFVGDKFANKVRQVYYDKNTKKNIYGTTTSKEREELREEGINLISVPWVEKDN